ncbi:MAG: Holliday junction branch migration protein RuvA [Phycisphaerae bacterium]
MIVRLTGLLAELSEEAVVVERDGLAYELLVPRYAIFELGTSRGRTVTLHTLEYYEGAAGGGNLTPRIIGFPHVEDRDFFETFITVKGIGVRKGLRMLSEPVARVAGLIESADAAGLARLPGIGRRTAEQIVATLRGKVTAHALSGSGPPSAVQDEWSPAQRDAIEVMVAWGDPRGDAERWLARAAQIRGDLKSADEWVRAAYRIKTGAQG